MMINVSNLDYPIMDQFRDLGCSAALIQKMSSEYDVTRITNIFRDVQKLLKENFKWAEVVTMGKQPSFPQVVHAIEEHLKIFTNLGFDHADLASISSRTGAADTLAFIAKNHRALMGDGKAQLGLNSTQMSRIASNNGAMSTLSYLAKNSETLIGNGKGQLCLSLKDLTKITSHGGVSGVLMYLVEHYEALVGMGLSHNQIIRIASKNGAVKVMQYLERDYQILEKEDFSLNQQANVAAHTGGRLVLIYLGEHYKVLMEIGLSRNQIIRVASNNGSVKTMQSLVKHYRVLVQIDFSHDQLVRIASHAGASYVLNYIAKYSEFLMGNSEGQLGFTVDHVTHIASGKGRWNKFLRTYNCRGGQVFREDPLSETEEDSSYDYYEEEQDVDYSVDNEPVAKRVRSVYSVGTSGQFSTRVTLRRRSFVSLNTPLVTN